MALDTGFERRRVLSVETSLRMAGYDSVRSATYARSLEERLRAIPEARAIARGDLPLVQRARMKLTTTGKNGDVTRDGYFNGVTPAYFDAFGIPIVRGRAFSDAERKAKARVAVVTEATARNLWGSDEPLGQRVTIAPTGKVAKAFPGAFAEPVVVVGVARDAQITEIGVVPQIYVYVPGSEGSLVMRVDGDVARVAAAVRGVGRSLDANALVTATPLEELIFTRTAISGAQAAAVFAGAIGVLALVLAAIGIFGLVAYSVARRTHELGVRRALGARAQDVVSLVVLDGLRAVRLGAVVGVALGAFATRLLSSLMFGMNPIDPLAYGGVAVVMSVVASLACYVPARRAARVDPLTALKSE
ncbi:MAG: ABC transporter permease [bacterium]